MTNEIIKRPGKVSIDEAIKFVWEMTVEDFLRLREHAQTAAEALVCTTYSDAIIMEKVGTDKYGKPKMAGFDLRSCNQIINRVCGNAPTADKIDDYESPCKQALEYALHLNKVEAGRIVLTDTCGIAVAKVLLMWKNNKFSKQYRDEATQIIFDRLGGRQSAPVEQKALVEETRPSWYID